MTFDKNYWTEQLKKEVGLEAVPYEQLHEHFVDFSTPFSLTENKVNAKDYVDAQLEIIKAQYDEFSNSLGNLNSFTNATANRNAYNEFDVMSRLDIVSQNTPTESPVFPDLNNVGGVRLLEPVQQQVKRESVKYYDVFIGGKEFTVAFNVESGDNRVLDHIQHLRNTSYFVEDRNPLTFTGGETIISYYQFVNLVELAIREKKTDDVQNKISQNIKTEFDGLKLDNFS